MPPADIEVIATARGKRTRQATQPMGALPALGTAQQALLRKWLKADARERAWQSLLDAAGLEHLDVAESLLALLLQCGAVAVKEEFHSGHWRPWRVVWADVEALQTQFQESLGTRVNIETSGTGKGRVIIHYYSDEELQAVFDAIIGEG